MLRRQGAGEFRQLVETGSCTLGWTLAEAYLNYAGVFLNEEGILLEGKHQPHFYHVLSASRGDLQPFRLSRLASEGLLPKSGKGFC